jgi:hypothetical protein
MRPFTARVHYTLESLVNSVLTEAVRILGGNDRGGTRPRTRWSWWSPEKVVCPLATGIGKICWLGVPALPPLVFRLWCLIAGGARCTKLRIKLLIDCQTLSDWYNSGDSLVMSLTKV